jgi:para-nitrobenzyl esterase
MRHLERDPLIVETSRGRVEGRHMDGLEVFRGIPFAASTAGPGRWRAPRPPESWSGVRPALEPGPMAPQRADSMSGILSGGGDRPMSEDCLTLDLWTPGVGGPARPVMVWIHGGGFTTGSGGLSVYDGGRLAREGGVVVVTFNYRLGALGFLHLPELADEGGPTGNFGLLDQIAALDWVRENVERFGGDPARITLFAQSAGAMCAGALLTAPRARGLFSRLILQSGAAHNVHTPATAARVCEVFCESVGVPPAPGDERVARLRALPWQALVEGQGRTLETLRGEIPEPPFQPVVDGDVLPVLPRIAIERGEVAPVPLLVGTNRDEWKFYGLSDPKAAVLDEAGLVRRFRRGLPGRDRSGREWAERVVEHYREARAGVASVEPRELWFAIQTDRWFRHPAIRLAECHARLQPETHAYLFTWSTPLMNGMLGSCHALEIPFVFGGAGRPGLEAIVPGDPIVEALSRRMRDTWAAFAAGEPPSWSAYEPAQRVTRIFGEECGVVSAPADSERAFWDEFWDEVSESIG